VVAIEAGAPEGLYPLPDVVKSPLSRPVDCFCGNQAFLRSVRQSIPSVLPISNDLTPYPADLPALAHGIAEPSLNPYIQVDGSRRF